VIGIFKSEPFDLVIMDITKTGTNGLGLELIKEVKKLSDDIEVIVLTGSPSVENAVKALRDYGAFDFLCKPLERADQLTNAVKKALQKHISRKNRSVPGG
jgi:DNA-binding NtrC family response regulator